MKLAEKIGRLAHRVTHPRYAPPAVAMPLMHFVYIDRGTEYVVVAQTAQLALVELRAATNVRVAQNAFLVDVREIR